MNWANRQKKKRFIFKIFFRFGNWKIENRISWMCLCIFCVINSVSFISETTEHSNEGKLIKWEIWRGKKKLKKKITPWEAEAANEIPLSTSSTAGKVDRMDSDFGFEIWVFVFISNSDRKKNTIKSCNYNEW